MTTLIVFARALIEGQVKTRLAANLGGAAALTLYRALLADVCALTRNRADRRVLAVAGEPGELVEWARREGMTLVDQGEGDLGARMDRALTRTLAHGPACLVGSDAPTLPGEYVSKAFGHLKEVDVVLGPANDGGYYLVGLARSTPELFTGIQWSTPTVLEQTLRRITPSRVALLPKMSDVDDVDDLGRLEVELNHLPLSVAANTRQALRNGISRTR